jgi:hypothetical protein
LIGLGYLPAQGAWLLIAVGVLHSAALAPLPPLSDGRRSSNFHLVCDAVLAQSWLHHARERTKIVGIRSGRG